MESVKLAILLKAIPALFQCIDGGLDDFPIRQVNGGSIPIFHDAVGIREPAKGLLVVNPQNREVLPVDRRWRETVDELLKLLNQHRRAFAGIKGPLKHGNSIVVVHQRGDPPLPQAADPFRIAIGSAVGSKCSQEHDFAVEERLSGLLTWRNRASSALERGVLVAHFD